MTETAATAESAKRYSSSEVSMMLAQRWDLPCGREALVKVSDELGLQTRDTPRAHRRWTADQVDKIADELEKRRRSLVTPSVRRALVEQKDDPTVQQFLELLDGVAQLPALQHLLTGQTTAA